LNFSAFLLLVARIVREETGILLPGFNLIALRFAVHMLQLIRHFCEACIVVSAPGETFCSRNLILFVSGLLKLSDELRGKEEEEEEEEKERATVVEWDQLQSQSASP
jgi:hypothetical protein